MCVSECDRGSVWGRTFLMSGCGSNGPRRRWGHGMGRRHGQRTKVHFNGSFFNARSYPDDIRRPKIVPFIHSMFGMLCNRVYDQCFPVNANTQQLFTKPTTKSIFCILHTTGISHIMVGEWAAVWICDVLYITFLMKSDVMRYYFH